MKPVFKLQEKINALSSIFKESQLLCLLHGRRGEEGQYFTDKLEEFYKRYTECPRTYQTDGSGGKAIAQFRYFLGNSEFHIVELDISGPPHIQAYGFASINGHYSELGYINIQELIDAGFELDFNFNCASIEDLGLWRKK